MICEFEGKKWDAVFLNETYQVRNLGDTSQTHVHGCRKIRQQTQSWNYAEQEMSTKNHQYISEKGHHTTIMVNHHRIKLMSVNFHHSGYADHHLEKIYRTIEKHTNSSKKSFQIFGGDFRGELKPGHGVECTSVGPHTPKGGNKEETG